MEFKINLETFWISSTNVEQEKYKACIHSGNAGDIIYSLPTAKELGAEHFVINLCTDPAFGGLGGRNIDFNIARSLSVLLLKQPYIKKVSIIKSNIPLEGIDISIEGIDFILDKFRRQDVFKNHIAICHAEAFGLHINLFQKWLYINSTLSQSDNIVVALTSRYRSLPNQYWVEALTGLKNLIVLGIPTDFQNLAGVTADFVTCNNCLDMAKIIANANLFIGNPSLPYAIAEALKIPRIIEIPESPKNAYPIGKNGHIAPSSVFEFRSLIKTLITLKSEEAFYFQNINLRKEVSYWRNKYSATIIGKGEKLLVKYYNFRDKLLPFGSKRRKFCKKLKELVKKNSN